MRPWPSGLAEQVGRKPTSLSRAQVLAVARTGAATASWTETLVASYVWGQGDIGYGAHRLDAPAPVEAALAQAVALLAANGPGELPQAERRDRRPWTGVLTKFLYFAGGAVADAPGPRPLILDRRIARVLRAYTTRLGGGNPA
ncbi:8-oxoguanine DNA glycosylase OGG fold protein [Streptomyces anulatus]|uniref:8-oxoguanine DNA glycosylase OGG fold protein n=1 Tax=Streptomyces anulatus TaxID=1892 RepID=UPI00398720C4